MGLLSQLSSLFSPPARVTGRPPSGNGASSFHLHWQVPPRPFVEAAAIFELLEPPTVERLYFWALQVSFVQGSRRFGGAHTGLQHHPNYPDRCAVNWGGYHDGTNDVLDGSSSPLACEVPDVNTHTYRWYPHRPYRFRVHRSPERGWRSTVTDLSTGEENVVRDLWVDGDQLTNLMVWSEVFADCDHPSVAVRWSELSATSADGEVVAIDSVRVAYQSHTNGGCANTDSSIDGSGFVQRTATERTTPTGTILRLPPD